MADTFRILCFDGGGYRGRLTALMLIELQEALDARCAQIGSPPRSVFDCFDLIAGTSTGSLISALLSTGKSAAAVLEIFKTDGSVIFASPSPGSEPQVGPLFDGMLLENALQKHLGDTRFGSLSKHLLITAYDSWNNRPLSFRSYDSACHGIRLFDACRGSSAYPAAFPSHALTDTEATHPYFQELLANRSYFSVDYSCDGGHGIPLIDGGIGANNPASVALAESVTSLLARPQETLLVSFGTGQMPPCINFEQGSSFSTKEWNGSSGYPLLEMMMLAYSRVSDDLCRTILGDQRYYRFQPVLLPENVDNALINKNGVIRISAAEASDFAMSTFLATEPINALFDRVASAYFACSDDPCLQDSPRHQMEALVTHLV